ncbi:Cytochrome c-type biogenesis protein CcmH [bacterium HR39]|nr:Cytochrome c-type biogenesis protein CcmH [bacterium HR39]
MAAVEPVGYAVLALATVLFLLWPAVRRRRRAVDRVEAELALAREQLAEIRRDLGVGLITPEAARAAEVEIKRRMLELDRHRERERLRETRAGRAAVALAALLVPLLGGWLYLRFGRPDMPDMPLAARTDLGKAPRAVAEADVTAGAPSIPEMVARLERRLAENPDDLEGQLMLARSYMVLERYGDAARVYAKVRELAPELEGIDSARGEALVLAEGGVVGEEARRAFEAELARHPRDPRARFYLALAAEQAGEYEKALEGYLRLGRESRPDAPWLPELRRRIEAVAGELGRDPGPLLAEVGRADSAAEIAALERSLSEDPRQWRAWLRLAELRAERGEKEEALAALESARAQYEGAPFVLRQIEQARARILEGRSVADAQTGGRPGPTAEDMAAAADMSPEEQRAMIEQMVARLAARLEQQPDDIEGWRMLARSYRVLGRTQEALAAYRRVAEALPQDPKAQLDYARALFQAQPRGAPLAPEVVRAFERVAALAPDHPEVLFVLGLAAAEQGEVERARELWTRLARQLPEGSPVRGELEKRIRALDGATGRAG